MKKLWNDLLYEPVLMFTIAGTGMTAVNASVDSAIFDLVTVFVVAVGGAITRHYTRSKRSLDQ